MLSINYFLYLKKGFWGFGGLGWKRTCCGPRRAQRIHGTQFTCFTSTKVQILTPEELLESAVEQAMSEMEERWLWCGEEEDVIVCEMVDVLFEELLADTVLSFC